MVEAEPYWEKLRRLRESAELAQHEVPGVSLGTIRALEKPYESQRDGVQTSARYPSPAMLERLARGLGVPPDTFDEYRLAKARVLLDERVAGLDLAVARLDQITAALQLQAAQRSATTATQRAEHHRTLEAMRAADSSPEADG